MNEAKIPELEYSMDDYSFSMKTTLQCGETIQMRGSPCQKINQFNIDLESKFEDFMLMYDQEIAFKIDAFCENEFPVQDEYDLRNYLFHSVIWSFVEAFNEFMLKTSKKKTDIHVSEISHPLDIFAGDQDINISYKGFNTFIENKLDALFTINGSVLAVSFKSCLFTKPY